MSDFRLRVFSSVAKNLSFTKASQELFISQPAITKHIQELETMYQTRLFERMGNKILLTDAGRLLLEHCEKILEDYGRLEYEMNLLRNEHTGELRLGASTTIAQYVLPPLLARFIEKFPQVSSGKFKVLDIKDLVMFREFDFVQLQGQDTGLPALFMQFANHYKEKL